MASADASISPFDASQTPFRPKHESVRSEPQPVRPELVEGFIQNFAQRIYY